MQEEYLQSHVSVKGALLIPPPVLTWGAPRHRSPSCSGKAPSAGLDHVLTLGKGAALVPLAFRILSVPVESRHRHANETQPLCNHHLSWLHGVYHW